MSGRQITPHFNEDELRCTCGCEQMKFSDDAIEKLEKLRAALNAPIHITSGYRCPEHNASVSSTGRTGPHTITTDDNLTVDIGVSGVKAFNILRLAPELGFTGVGIKQNGTHSGRFIHLDRIVPGGRAPRPWVWSY